MIPSMVSTGMIAAFVLLTNLLISVKDHMLPVFCIVFAADAICFFASYKIAVKMYQKWNVN